MKIFKNPFTYLTSLVLFAAVVFSFYTECTDRSSAHGGFSRIGGNGGLAPPKKPGGPGGPGGPGTGGGPSGPGTGEVQPPGEPGGPGGGSTTPNDPPPPPPVNPPNDVSGPQTGGLTPPDDTPPSGPGIPGNNPGGGQTGGKGPKGGHTKKNRPVTTTPIDWEYWWARNRFQYFDLSDLMESAGNYPVTPRPKGAPGIISALQIKCLGLMRPMLNDDSARLRRAALISMARLNDGDHLSDMMKLLKDRNQTVRDYAVMALGVFRKAEATHTLLHVARGTKKACDTLGQSSIPDYFRGFALLSLALSNTDGIDVTLKSLALDESCAPEIRAMALESLGLKGGEDAAKFLMDFVDDQKVPRELLAAAVTAVHKTNDPAVRPFLEKCLYSDCIPVRQSAAIGLGYLAGPGDDEVVKKLFRGFKQTYDQALKGFCLVSMGQIGGATAVQYLDHVMRKGRSSEKPWACLGLGLALREREDKRMEERLIAQLKTGSNRSLQGAAAVALGLKKSSNAITVLTKLMQKGDDPVLRSYCALALGMIGDPASVGPLRKTLQNDNLPVVRIQVSFALALMRNKAAVPELADLLLTTQNDVTKTFIALSLAYLGEISTVENLLAAIREKKHDELTLMHCAHVTSKLLSGWTKPYLERIAAGSNFACEYPMVRYLLDFGI